MRVTARAVSLSWIPSESITGSLRVGFDVGLSHYDPPPPPALPDDQEVQRLLAADRFRFANVLDVFVDTDDDGHIVGSGHTQSSGLLMGSTTVRVSRLGATFRGFSLPVLRPVPQARDGAVRFVQTVGGRTGVPLPRPTPHPPYAAWQAPLVWTTLALTVFADGRREVELAGASAFPRHWVYGPDGRLTAKSAVTDLVQWVAHSFGERTPWGEQDSPAIVTAAETALEVQLAADIMQTGRRPSVRRHPAGTTLTRQGDAGDEIYLLLDGVLSIDVDGARLGEVGPGAVLGERAVLENGRRTSTLTAVTPIRVAVAARDALDVAGLAELREQHNREDSGDASS